MKIFKITTSKENPYTQKVEGQILNSYWSESDGCYWILWTSDVLSQDEISNILENDELLDKYLES
jgi:hypothetical protein